MIKALDYFLKQEIPILILCNPSQTPVASLKGAFEITNTIRFNSLSELVFKFPKSPDKGETIFPAYDLLRNKMTVFLKDVGYYVITECSEDSTGRVPIKEVTCESLESLMLTRRVTGLSVISKMLYNSTDITDSMLNILLQYFPGWGVDYVDPLCLYETISGEQKPIRRSFTIDNNTLYNVLITEIEFAYNCVITFDTIEKKISAYSLQALSNYTPDIFLSFNTINNQLTITEYSDEMTTCMYCYGSGDLSINAVNPLRTNAIYNFDYYLDSEWMDDDLKTSLTAWNVKYQQKQTVYEEQFTDYWALFESYYETSAALTEATSQRAALVDRYYAEEANNQSTDGTVLKIKDATANIQSYRKTLSDKQDTINAILRQMNETAATLVFNRVLLFQRFLDYLSSSGTYDNSSVQNILENIKNTWKTYYRYVPLLNEFSSATGNYLVREDGTDGYKASTLINNLTLSTSALYDLINFVKGMITDINSVDDNYLNQLKVKINNFIIPFENALSNFTEVLDNTYTCITMRTVIYNIKTFLDNDGIYNGILSSTYGSNLTDTEYEKLQYYFFENTYSNENIYLKEDPTLDERKTAIFTLYNQSKEVLSRASKPRYEISGDFINIFNISEYASIVEKLELGNLVSIEFEKNKIVKVALLEIEFQYDDPTSFNMIFSNKTRLNNSNFQFADLFFKSAADSSSVSGL